MIPTGSPVSSAVTTSGKVSRSNIVSTTASSGALRSTVATASYYRTALPG